MQTDVWNRNYAIHSTERVGWCIAVPGSLHVPFIKLPTAICSWLLNT